MPGESARINGKLGGRPKLQGTILNEKLRKIYEIRGDELANALIGKALGDPNYEAVDVAAHREINDRIAGKAAQAIDHTTNGESLNERITKLDDGQLETLIASVQGGVGRVALGKAEENQGESTQVRETAPEAT